MVKPKSDYLATVAIRQGTDVPELGPDLACFIRGGLGRSLLRPGWKEKP